MPTVNNSNYMNLPIPVVGQESGPQYATDINNCLTIIDQHNHANGSGNLITPAGLNITSDLSMQSNDLTATRTINFSAQTSPLTASSPDLGCIYVAGVDLYYNDESGNQVRITQSGAIAGTPGSISGLPSGTASASYSSGSQTFVWQSATLTPANLDAGSVILRNVTASSNGITLSAPAALGSNYTITMPALPASNGFMTIDSAGAISTSTAVSGGITSSMLAAAVAAALNPPGSIHAYGGTSAPTGYLLCDGSAVSRTTYSGLYAIIGTAYGYGDNATTFNVPDFRGQFLRGVSGSSTNDPDKTSRTAMATGGNTGNNVGSIQANAYTAHTHATGYQADFPGTGTRQLGYDVSNNSNTTQILTLSSGTSTETRPINAYVNFIIKT